jgi:hypothetical protein
MSPLLTSGGVEEVEELIFFLPGWEVGGIGCVSAVGGLRERVVLRLSRSEEFQDPREPFGMRRQS